MKRLIPLRSAALAGPAWLVALVLPAVQAQPVPAGGYELREVTQLVVTPELPGGLVPYRVNERWGYADTTGRILIRPMLAGQPNFFLNGLTLITALDAASAQWLPGAAPPQPADGTRYVLNCRGEVLRVRPHEAAVRQPDGSLRAVLHWQAYGQWEVTASYIPGVRIGEFVPYQVRRVRPADDPPLNLPEGAYHVHPLGAGRVSYKLENPELHGLFTRTGRQLTAYAYKEIRPFNDNKAAFQLPDQVPDRRQRNRWRRPGYWGYLDTLGHVVIAPQFKWVTEFRHGWAVVADSLDREYIIDRAGRRLPQSGPAAFNGPDEAGYIRQQLPGRIDPDQPRYRYLAPPGRPSLAHLAFDQAGPFQQQRAWVRQGKREGLIDQAGRWVTPLAYEHLWTPALLDPTPPKAEHGEELPALAMRDLGEALPDVGEQSLDVPGVTYPRPDAGYLLARRAGKYGVVARRTGREVVPAVYDSLLFSPLRGTVCLGRANRAYVVSLSTGRAVEGRYRGIDFLTPQGRRLYVTRSGPARWALLDPAGRRRTTWVPGTGYPLFPNRLLSREAARWTLRDTTGRVVYSTREVLGQLPGDIRWKQVCTTLKDAHAPGQGWEMREYGRSGGRSMQSWDGWPAWQLSLPAQRPEDRAAYTLGAATLGSQLLDNRLRPLGPPLAPPGPGEIHRLPSAWTYLLSTDTALVAEQRRGRALPVVVRLCTDDGHWLPAAPAGVEWAYLPDFDYSYAWRRYGVLPTWQGYITRGGRPLWQP